MSNEEKGRLVRQAGYLGNVLSTGFTGGVCVAIGIFLGLKADDYLHSAPYGISAGILIGLAAGILQTWKQIKEGMGALKNERDRSKK